MSTMITKEPGTIITEMCQYYGDTKDYILFELDWDWAEGKATQSGALVDYDWLSVVVLRGDPVMRWRGQYPKGHWSSWHYVYGPEFIQVPEEVAQ
jgi:hypothetical protein